MRYRFESKGSKSQLKGNTGGVRPLVLVLIAGVPAAISLLALLLTPPAPAPSKTTPLAMTPQAVLGYVETPAPTHAPAPASQPRTAIAAQPQPVIANPQAEPTSVPLDDNTVPCAQRHTPLNLWCVEFFADRDQIGAPVWVEIVPALNYNFGRNSARQGVPPDNFKIAATGDFSMGRLDSYVYDLTVDGGARLWIDNQLAIDEWNMWKRRTKRVRVPLLQATHTLRVEYYDNRGAALLRLAPSIDHDVHHNWLGRYYNNANLENLPVMIREDPDLSFVWPLNPGQPVNNDNFSVQWIRILDVPADGYSCTLLADDKARVYVDGELVKEMNSWDAPNAGSTSAKLDAGRRFVEVHFAEFAGEARIEFKCEKLPHLY